MRGLKIMLFGIAVMMLGWATGEIVMLIGFFIVAFGGVIDWIISRYPK